MFTHLKLNRIWLHKRTVMHISTPLERVITCKMHDYHNHEDTGHNWFFWKMAREKLSFIVTFLMATAETPGLYSITLSTRRNAILHFQNQKRNLNQRSLNDSRLHN